MKKFLQLVIVGLVLAITAIFGHFLVTRQPIKAEENLREKKEPELVAAVSNREYMIQKTGNEKWPFDEETTKGLESLVRKFNPTNAPTPTNGMDWATYDPGTNFLTIYLSNRVAVYPNGNRRTFPLVKFTDQEWSLITNYYTDRETNVNEFQFYGKMKP